MNLAWDTALFHSWFAFFGAGCGLLVGDDWGMKQGTESAFLADPNSRTGGGCHTVLM